MCLFTDLYDFSRWRCDSSIRKEKKSNFGDVTMVTSAGLCGYKPQKTALVLLIFLGGLGLIAMSYLSSDQMASLHTVGWNVRHALNTLTNARSEGTWDMDPKTVNEQRLNHMRETCAKYPGRYKVPTDSKEEESHFIVDRKQSLVTCFNPKVASSTLKRIFTLLANRSEGQSLFAMSSNTVHAPTENNYDTLDQVWTSATFLAKYQQFRTSQKFLFVRDPYERIFSAFADRLLDDNGFIQMMTSKIFPGKPANISCQLQRALTFTDVIRYVITTKGDRLDSHFSLFYRWCLPCAVDYDYVGKLETFESDLTFILTSLGLDPQALLGTRDDMEDRHSVSILRDIATRTFRGFRRKSCFSRHSLLKRTWLEFQVRGYLPIGVPLPLSKVAANNMTLTQFQAVAMATYAKVKDRLSVKQQRQQAVREAYYAIPRDLLVKLQKVLQPDCDLFGYECDVSVRFPEGQGPSPVFSFNHV